MQKSRLALLVGAGLTATAIPAHNPVWAQEQPPALPGFIGDNVDEGIDTAADNLPPPPPSAEEGLDLDSLPEFDFEKSPEQREKEVREKAFKAALQGLLPMHPEEIRKLLEYYDRTQESVEVPIYPAPKPNITIETLSLDPGHTPVTVNLAFGHVTTFNTLDITGSPWPIEDMSWAGNFDVMETDTGANANIVRITPQTEFAQGNMSIRLVGLNTPVIVMLDTSREKVDYRFDAVIPEYGPMANSPIIQNNTSLTAGNIDMAKILQGVPPQGAKKLSVAGVDGRTTAYNMNEMTYLRTPLHLLSPGWSQSVASADGMKVYEIKESPVVLLSDDGKMVRARLSEREDISYDDE